MSTIGEFMNGLPSDHKYLVEEMAGSYINDGMEPHDALQKAIAEYRKTATLVKSWIK